MAAPDDTVRFETKADVNRVEFAVQESDETIVLVDAPLETRDLGLIAALDAAEGVKRSEGRKPAGDKAQPPAQPDEPSKKSGK